MLRESTPGSGGTRLGLNAETAGAESAGAESACAISHCRSDSESACAPAHEHDGKKMPLKRPSKESLMETVLDELIEAVLVWMRFLVITPSSHLPCL